MRRQFLFVFLFLSVSLPAEIKKLSSDVGASPHFAEAMPDARLDVYIMGDSITAGEMAYNNGFVMMSRTTNRRQHGWSLDLHANNKGNLKSLSERLSESYPLRMTNAAWSGAYVDKATKLDRSLANKLGNIQNFSQQVQRLRDLKEQPNLIVIAPFHNNLDYDYEMKEIKELKGTKVEDYLKVIPVAISDEYQKELRDLFKKCKDSKQKVSFMVLGNLNMKAGLSARDKAGELHKENPKVFPYYEVANERFQSTLPKNREKMIGLAEAINSKLKESVDELNKELKKDGLADFIQVRYSTAMTDADLSETKDLHADDAFHPSEQGHNKIAEQVEKDISKNIDFLGVKRN